MKAVKIIILSCLMTGIFQTAIPQQIKSYNGPFKEGTATYQYYDDNYERVYQGSFTYTSEYLNITGQYNKNVKVGKWSFTKRTNPLYENLKETLVGEYNNGKMNGLWTLKRTDLKTNKILINSSAFFKEGYLTSEFKYYNSKENYFRLLKPNFCIQITNLLAVNYIDENFIINWFKNLSTDIGSLLK